MRWRKALVRILVYGLNYAPELTGIGKYTGEMATWLSSRGHDVRVVTTPPYYPAWQVQESYRKWAYAIEEGAGIPTVYRCPIYVPKIPVATLRIIHLFSFAASSVIPLIRLIFWKPEVVLTIVPTLFCTPVSLIISTCSGCPSWLHIQDFEMDAAFDLGLLPPGGFLQRLALALEGQLLRRFSRVSTVSGKMVERAVRKGVPPPRAVLFPNWVDTDAIFPLHGPNVFRQELGLENKLIVLYSGNLGQKQGLDIVEPLTQLFEADQPIHFLICGDGELRPTLERLAARSDNLTLLPLQPTTRFNELLNAADIHLLPQLAGAADLVMPSKLTGMLASGRPVIATADLGTEIALVLGAEDSPSEMRGLIVPPGDVSGLANAIRSLGTNPEFRGRLGAAARRYAEEELGKDQVLARFEAGLNAMKSS